MPMAASSPATSTSEPHAAETEDHRQPDEIVDAIIARERESWRSWTRSARNWQGRMMDGAKRMGDIAPLVRRPVETQPDEKYHEVGIRSFGKGCFRKPVSQHGTGFEEDVFMEGRPRLNIVFAWESAVAVAGPEEMAKSDPQVSDLCGRPGPSGRRFLCGGLSMTRAVISFSRRLGGAGAIAPWARKARKCGFRFPRFRAKDRRVWTAHRAGRGAGVRRRRDGGRHAGDAGQGLRPLHRGRPRRPWPKSPPDRRPVGSAGRRISPNSASLLRSRHLPQAGAARWRSELAKLFGIEKGDLVFSNIKAWEGAFAVAGEDDHGRVGSHRYLTCVRTRRPPPPISSGLPPVARRIERRSIGSPAAPTQPHWP